MSRGVWRSGGSVNITIKYKRKTRRTRAIACVWQVHRVASNLLLQEGTSVHVLGSSVYAIKWKHQLAGINETFNMRVVSKRTINARNTKEDDLLQLCNFRMLLVPFARFLRFDEVQWSLSITVIPYSGHLLISGHLLLILIVEFYLKTSSIERTPLYSGYFFVASMVSAIERFTLYHSYGSTIYSY